jgi:hypothetical protein
MAAKGQTCSSVAFWPPGLLCAARPFPFRLRTSGQDVLRQAASPGNPNLLLWANMKRRCVYDPNVERFKNYAGRGIKVGKNPFNRLSRNNLALSSVAAHGLSDRTAMLFHANDRTWPTTTFGGYERFPAGVRRVSNLNRSLSRMHVAEETRCLDGKPRRELHRGRDYLIRLWSKTPSSVFLDSKCAKTIP